MNLTKTDWPLGWTPSADPVNGDPGGLLRMDNLQRDEQGAITLVRGLQQIATYSDYVSDIYSKNFQATEVDYIALNTNGHSIYRGQTLIGSGNARCAFGDALGQVVALAGSSRYKDDGTITKTLGLATPKPPTVGAASQNCIGFWNFSRTVPFATPQVTSPGSFTTLVGTVGTGENDDWAIEMVNDPSTNVMEAVYNLGNVTDSTQIPTFVNDNVNSDIIQFFVQPADPTILASVTVDFLLDKPPYEPSGLFVQNYYTFTFDNPQLTLGPQALTWLTVQRGQFQRNGTDPTLDWRHVTGIRYTIVFTAYTFCDFGGMQIIGGAQGQLNGTYTYIQVDVTNNGVYEAKSPASDPTDPIWVINGAISITPSATNPDATETWIFRGSAVSATATPPQGFPNQASFLDQFYRVAVVNPGETFVDDLSDNEAIQINIVANQFLETFVFADENGLQDNIFMVAGLFKERMLYMGNSYIYVSDALNIDAVDTRFTIKAFGDPTEINMWLKKVNNNVLLLGTTKDLYEISGTFEQLPDGTIDITITPIGEAYPPLSYGAGVVNGGVFYIAADGLRVSTGSTSVLISPQLRLLFQGESREGIPPVNVIPNDVVRYILAVGKTKVYFTVPMQDGTRRLIVYDTVTSQFTLRYTDPVTIYATQSDRVLVGYGAESTNPNTPFGSLYLLDSGSGVTDSGGNNLAGFPFTLQTVYDSNQQPRNRKDTFTLKLICDTGGAAVNVFIDKDNQGIWTNLGQVACNGLTTNYFPLPGVTLGFRYALMLTDVDLITTFRLYEYTIEYEPRPEQLDYLRILPTNLNSFARKRWTSFAYVIDTLGNSITFQPYVDNTATGAPDTFSTPTKLTHITFFDAETIGTDMGGIFSGGVFEFYGPNLEETVSEKLPTPTEFLIIPPNDYGTPHRKRHTSYKFQIITRGQNVQFTPLLDGVAYSPRVYNTVRKQTVEYFFDLAAGDVIGIDIGGTLQSIAGPPLVPFEFYGVVVPEQVETLPPRLEYFRIPNSNFGVAARKRIRTLPIVIDTYGENVTFTPIVDGLLHTSTTLNTNGKTTTFHYFASDIFGVDFGGILQSSATVANPFEFYELGQPENVETLPVAKVFDQLGPTRFDKIGKLFTLRLRLISLGDTSLPFQIYGDSSTTVPDYQPIPFFEDIIPLVPFTDQVYEYQFPKNVNTNVCRLVIGPTTNPFHRYDVAFRVSTSGMETDSKWIPVR